MDMEDIVDTVRWLDGLRKAPCGIGMTIQKAERRVQDRNKLRSILKMNDLH